MRLHKITFKKDLPLWTEDEVKRANDLLIWLREQGVRWTEATRACDRTFYVVW